MKRILSLLLVVLFIFSFSACAKQEPKELQMLWWSDGTEGQVMQTLLTEYETKTGVKIELVVIPYADYEARLATMISGGEAPALARVTEGHLNNFKGKILSLKGVYDSAGFTNLFYNDAKEVISLPMDITANGLFINVDLMTKYGVNYPKPGDDVWTWDQFETEVNKLRAGVGTDVNFPGVFDPQAHRFFPMVYQHGTKIWSAPYTTSNLTGAAAVKALTRLVNFYQNDLIDDAVFAGSTAAALFRTGAYGFHMSGNWNVSSYQDLTFNWTVVPMPKEANRATILGGKSIAAFMDSNAPTEAKKFITWLAKGENHDRFTGGVPYLTPRLGAEVDYGNFADEYAVFLDEIAATDASYVQDWLTQVMIPGMYPMINEAIRKAAAKEATPLEALQELEAKLKEAKK
jgi:alpha-1,4-digalacturonate transport system substrate-binding protein